MRVDQLKANHDIVVEWRGVEIHPEIPPEGLDISPQLRAKFGGMSDMLREEAQKAGLAMIVPEIIPKTRLALEASEYAREQGKHEAFHERLFRKFYGEGQDVSRWQVLRETAVSINLDPDAMQRNTERGDYAKIVNGRMQELFSLGASGVPLYIFDNKYAVVGLQPYEAFEEVMTHITADNARKE